jgi:N-acetylglucosamine kinase-like BadF-type ATPase
MRGHILIADSGATKTEWKLIAAKASPSIFTKGISPYHMTQMEIIALLRAELPANLFKKDIEQIFYYGTGCLTKEKASIVKKSLAAIFPEAAIQVTHDLMGAAIAVSGNQKGIACILGTGSNSCYYNGKRIVSNSPGLGYVLGDEGSGAYLGRKLVQHYLYRMLDDELTNAFNRTFKTSKDEILHKVYREPYANRYLAGFTTFLSAHRGHFMIENIIEDGLRDFFEIHVNSYPHRFDQPIHFVGSIAYYFKDKIAELCADYGLTMGTVLKQPMSGLVAFHKKSI